jgi:hypothetical protein
LTYVFHLQLIILSVEDDVPIDSETLLTTDFVNLKIKSLSLSNVLKPFGYAHRDIVYMCVFTGVGVHTCISIYFYIVFLKKASSSI